MQRMSGGGLVAVEYQHIKHAADIVHPVLDAFAQDYYAYLPQDLWPSVGVTAKRGREAVWHGDDPALRAQLREVARSFIDGDERLVIWRIKAR